MPATPADWLDEPLAAKMVRHPPHPPRGHRRPRSPAPRQGDRRLARSRPRGAYRGQRGDQAALKTVDFADICITSAISVTADPEPAEAFRLPETDGIGVVFETAEGDKCQRCWKILPDVGTHKHPGTCARCNEALDQITPAL